MRLTEQQIDELLRQRPISSDWPWETAEESEVDKHIKDVIAEVRRRIGVEDKTEFNHYGSGYASFVDCWMYRPNDAFRLGPGNYFVGLVILFSRLSPYYVVGQGEKSRDGRCASSYLPSFEFVDEITHPAAVELEREVLPVLELRGLIRLRAAELSEMLSPDRRVPTILADRVFRHFDALFHWAD